MPRWLCNNKKQLTFWGVIFRSLSLSGCPLRFLLISSDCSSQHAERAALFRHRVVENFKRNICQQHIISCGCPSHEFFALLCLLSCTLLISDHASFSLLFTGVQVSFNVETSLHCWSVHLFLSFFSNCVERLGQVVTSLLASSAQYVTFLHSSGYATSYFIPQTVCWARCACLFFQCLVLFRQADLPIFLDGKYWHI